MTWLPLMEYAIKNSVSLSTLRRYIKAGKVEYRLEEGRYLIWDTQERSSGSDAQESFAGVSAPVTWSGSTPSDASTVNAQLRDAQEEIAELKMLVAIYEEQLALASHDQQV